jgi:HPt (histidine-containing phosphotransfer) domain-containing protein
LAQEIREYEDPGQYLPIVALTEATDIVGTAGLHRERCLDAGMDDTLANSASAQQIAAVLAKWVEPVYLAIGEIWDRLALARSLESHDAVVIHRLMERFMANTESQLSLMDQCLRDQDLQGLERLAHNLKSAARTVGAMPLGALCQSLEHCCRSVDQVSAPGLLDQVNAAYRDVHSAMRLELK